MSIFLVIFKVNFQTIPKSYISCVKACRVKKYVVFGMDVRVAPKFWLRGILSGTLAGLQTLASTSHYKFHTLPHMRIWNWKAYFTLQIPYSAAYGSMELEGVLHITNSILCRIWEYAIGR